MTYRETGSGLLDYFCYKLDLPSTGEAMIAELVVPDDADRYIYSAVLETVPAGMEHNTPPLGSKAWPNASGTVSTGDLYPLSNGKKKFRYVFFPGTKNTTLLVQNGRAGIPAAVCEINIYAVKGGLPALKIPKTDRTYGNHNERLIFNAWGSYGNALAYGTEAHLVQYYDGAWITAYRAIARKIQFLRFQGHNASVEGAFMYENGVFSSRHAQTVLNNDSFDYYHALLKLYKHNNIKTFVGFEYMRSSALDAMGAYDTSDAQVHSGKKRTVYMVDRFGQQVVGYMGMGLNCMNPVVWGTVTDLLKELYQRYDGIGNVEGLVTLNGSWWLPGFPSYSNMEAAEVGYDDDSVEQFEHDTGIRLNLPRTGAERFPARYQLLTGKYKQQWFAWRGKKIREKLLEMRKIVSSGTRNAEDRQLGQTEMATLLLAGESLEGTECVQHSRNPSAGPRRIHGADSERGRLPAGTLRKGETGRHHPRRHRKHRAPTRKQRRSLSLRPEHQPRLHGALPEKRCARAELRGSQ